MGSTEETTGLGRTMTKFTARKHRDHWHVDGLSSPNNDFTESEARLIAAAPDLLADLKFVLAFYEPAANRYLDTEAWKVAHAQALAAVAKAE